MTHEEAILERFKAAAAAGKIRELDLVWSPLNTLADTRYRFIDNDGNSHVLLHREVNGFLTGMGT